MSNPDLPNVSGPTRFKPKLSGGEHPSNDIHRQRVFRRLSVLSHRAVEVLAEGMESPDERVRVVCAQEVLNRRFGKPKQEQEVVVAVQDMATLHLEALKALAEQGLKSVEGQAQTLNLVPVKYDQD